MGKLLKVIVFYKIQNVSKNICLQIYCKKLTICKKTEIHLQTRQQS